MHVIVSSPVSQIATSIAVSCSMVDLPCELEPSVQEFGSKLFRNPDAIGVFWSPGPASAAEHCRRFRLADIRNLLFALVEEGAGFELDGDGRVLVLGAGARGRRGAAAVRRGERDRRPRWRTRGRALLRFAR